MKLSYEQRLRLWETHHGAEGPRVMERHGEPAALFTDPEWMEMFWVSYNATPLTQDPDLQRQMLTKKLWLEMDGLTWRNHELGLVAPHTFPSVGSADGDTRISMRSLYIDIPDQRPWDHIVLWLRKRRREANSRR